MNLKKINIFLADDDEDDRNFFQEAIMKIDNSCNLTMVDDGAKAIKYFKDKNELPDFVFLDINMPIKNGLECLKFIKELHASNNFHVIMLSTSLTPKDIEISYKYGASIYIQKPGKFSELVQYLDYCLNKLKYLTIQGDFILNHKLNKKTI